MIHIKSGALACMAISTLLMTAGTAHAAAARPAMVVVISVDQLRRDRLDGGMAGGLGRIASAGRVFTRASLDHGVTSTCPGHSVILTGMNPGHAGIPGNEYVDRQSWTERYCLGGDNQDWHVIGGDAVRSPEHLRVTALGDWMHKAWPGAKVYAVGGKDRAVIAMAGQHPDGAFWFDAAQGKFTSSRYYMDGLPGYVRAFDPLADLPRQWVHDPGPYRADDFEWESDRHSRHSPHPLGEGDRKEIASQFWDSPYQDTAVFTLARKIIAAEHLGDGGPTDLLAIALSANDAVGHLYGPMSGEAYATLRNIDRQLGSFIAWLDDRFGRDRVTIVLTADHGVLPIPEWTAEKGENVCPVDDGRVSVYGFVLGMYWYVYSKFTWPFGLPTKLVKFAGEQITVNRAYAKARGLDPEKVIAGLKARLEEEKAVRKVWTRAGISSGKGDVARLYRHSLVDDKSGDLFVQMEPGCIVRDGSGTGHGTVYDYDRDIPLVFYGWGIGAGQSGTAAHSVDIAPSLARLLGLPVPPGLDGRPLSLGSGPVATQPEDSQRSLR